MFLIVVVNYNFTKATSVAQLAIRIIWFKLIVYWSPRFKNIEAFILCKSYSKGYKYWKIWKNLLICYKKVLKLDTEMSVHKDWCFEW